MDQAQSHGQIDAFDKVKPLSIAAQEIQDGKLVAVKD
jgi:DNA-directed RNA polymerase subunit K/omega